MPLPTCVRNHFTKLEWLSSWDAVREKHNAQAVANVWLKRTQVTAATPASHQIWWQRAMPSDSVAI